MSSRNEPPPPLLDEVPLAAHAEAADLSEDGETDEPTQISFADHIQRARSYRFVLDDNGEPLELGSGRFAKCFLGEEVWLESKTAFRRQVAIKVLQRGVSEQDQLRFQVEKELLERVQGHPNIITLYASGETAQPGFIPDSLRDKIENDFAILELCDMSLEERLKGTRGRTQRDDLLVYPFRERLLRVLEYMVPVAAAVEYAHLIRNVCHRDIKPGNILLKVPDSRLQGDLLGVRLADFNVGKVQDDQMTLSLTQVQGVPGTIYFQAPEQETNSFELLVNVQRGQKEVDFFEDFYIGITKNDVFQLFNRSERYRIVGCDRQRKKILLEHPFREASETNVRAKITKRVDRPADLYSLGATFYYLVTGAYGNPKTLYDAFHKFIEYDRNDEQNTIDAYIEHEYAIIQSLRGPKVEQSEQEDRPQVAPEDRFFTYKQYLDGNSELIDKEVMKIIARAMIRNKPDSYCQLGEVDTDGVSRLIRDLRGLYERYGVHAVVPPAQVTRAAPPSRFGWVQRLVRWARRMWRDRDTWRPRLPGNRD